MINMCMSFFEYNQLKKSYVLYKRIDFGNKLIAIYKYLLMTKAEYWIKTL